MASWSPSKQVFPNAKKKKKSTTDDSSVRNRDTSGTGNAPAGTTATGTRAIVPSPNVGIQAPEDYSYKYAQEQAADLGAGGTGNLTANGGVPLGGTRPHTAFGREFLPDAYPEIWANPVDTLLRQYFRDKGMGTQGGTFAMAQDNVDAMPGLWMLMNTAAPGSYGDFVDYSGKQIAQGLTPGGASYSPEQIFAAMEAQTQAGAPLAKYLANDQMGAKDQVGAYAGMLNNALQTSMPDVLRAAIMANVSELGGEYQRRAATGPQDATFGQFAGSRGVNPYQRR